MAQRSKVHQWRHWILIFLRTVLILLLLLAFLRPVLKRFGGNPADQAGRQVLILIDHSLSMEDKGDGPTSRERAAHEATKLIDSLSANDSVNVLLMEPESHDLFCFVFQGLRRPRNNSSINSSPNSAALMSISPAPWPRD